MDKPEGSEASDAEAELERVLRVRNPRHHEVGAEQHQGHQAALDGDAQAGLLGLAKGPVQIGLSIGSLNRHAMIPQVRKSRPMSRLRPATCDLFIWAVCGRLPISRGSTGRAGR